MNSSILQLGLANPGAHPTNLPLRVLCKELIKLQEQMRAKKAIIFCIKKSGISARHSVLTDFEKRIMRIIHFSQKSEKLRALSRNKQECEVFRFAAPKLCEEAVRDVWTILK